MPGYEDQSLALIRGASEFVTVIYGPAVTFVFPDPKVETYRRSVMHLMSSQHVMEVRSIGVRKTS